MDFTFHIG